ncbi:cellulose synthase subunit BcsC [Botrimarina colliarenosi]|uniref:Cellulose synthase subunit BcsC n=2 Tax=Botrimarina colliarenosi TaxID=2528001 RepID=A0A5C6A7J9_9BACT|nr:cellulose synthase subunit BcsC [Botrimarina colliarenosi]
MGVFAAPSSMLHTMPEPSAQSVPGEASRMGWLTKWFHGPSADPMETGVPSAAGPGVIAYQPPPASMPTASSSGAAAKTAWRGNGAVPAFAQNSPSQTTPLDTAARSPMGQGSPTAADAATPADEARRLREQGHAKDREGDLAAAEAIYRQAIGADPTSAAAVNDLGLCLARQGRLDASAAVLRQAIMMRPDKQLYRNNIATVLVEVGEIDEALTHLKTVCGPAAAHYNVGQILTRSGKTDEAVAQFEQALELDPNLRPAFDALTRITQPAADASFAQSTVQSTGEAESLAAMSDAPAPRVATATAASVAPQSESTPVESDADEEPEFTGPPSFPRLLPPVLNR